MATKDADFNEPLLRADMGFCEKASWPLKRVLFVAVALSLLVSMVGAIIVHVALLSHPPVEYGAQLLPGLESRPLGPILKAYNPDPTYTIYQSNDTREKWMQLFPRGMGYIQIDKVKELGIVPDFIRNVNSDGSGRFCVAAFHQLHCLYLIFEEFSQALHGQIKHPSGHTIHCYDYLRQSIMCAADSNLEPFRSRFEGMKPGDGVDGIGSIHQCRNFEELYAWADRFRYKDDADAEQFEG
ncbi:hypothetical protein ETB97_011433 [Aspergillus alliaceus]|uniref:Oxidase ustYa n=1 Tax=Petromyces alliaceus TaxID=209559 RepID=A0A8H6AHB6_PETAA|nr:hypothetical protein ETB97_011433 [Aspergillus burnettii]